MNATSAARAALALLLCLAPAACGVSQDTHKKALDEVHRARVETSQRGVEIMALKSHLTRCGLELQDRERRLQDREVRLQETTTAQADLIRRLDEAAVLNAELSERLRKAGQSVHDLAGERSTLAAALAETRTRLEELARQQAAAEARAAQFRDLVARFQKLAEAGQLRVVARDGRMLIELPDDVLFDAAKTELKPAGRGALVEVAKVLASMSDRRFQVAGHTDNVKIRSPRFASNWDLSTARAVEVVRLLVERGVRPETLSAAGYGEHAPVAPNDTPEGRARNRRIEIALVPDLAEMVKIPGAPAAPSSPPR
jgi:chemotaxis protein MotB